MSKRQCKKCKHLIELTKYVTCTFAICEKFRDCSDKPQVAHLVPKYCNKFKSKEK